MRLFPPGIPVSKRIFDILVTSLLMIIALPMMGGVAMLVWLKMGRPLLFRQVRPGYGGELFSLTKFRTMNDARDEAGALLPDEQRITPLGRFMRAFSLDELPELFSVLVGKMSLVGPRPLLVQYLERYTPEQARRHEVLPGITGWAQVNGRNILNWEDKFKLDVWYVDHWSLWLDVKILAMTLWKVITRQGISQPGHATAEEFMGSDIPE